MSRAPPHIFRAYDIRGIAAGADAEITENMAFDLGRAFVTELKKESKIKTDLRLVVGHDNRLTGEKLSAALIRGLTEAGAEVHDIGFATSPYLYFSVCVGGFDGGINVTGSHNPAEYNGFKLVRQEAIPLAGAEILSLRDCIEREAWGTKQNTGTVRRADFRAEYFQKLKELAPLKRKLKVVLDCGNGTAGYFAPNFFRELGAEVVELYCDPDGNFPNHLPNPEEVESLRDLQKKVIEVNADLGLAFDGDGDRVGVVDEQGVIILPDRLILLLARDLLSRRPGAEIIFDVKCSNVLANEIEKAGGKTLRWKTGHSFIKQKMRETGALLAGEVSGHIFFGENYYGVDDGLLAAAKVVSILAVGGRRLSEYFVDLPKAFITPEIKVPVADTVKFEVMKSIKMRLLKNYAGDTLDGIRMNFGQTAWGLVRPSNTSPYLSLRFEAESEERLVEIQKLIYEELVRYSEIDLSKWQI